MKPVKRYYLKGVDQIEFEGIPWWLKSLVQRFKNAGVIVFRAPEGAVTIEEA